ncbi:MAG: pyruvate:ferredoxin (flavodoxin) oxidoreductase [Chloroflexi bacterium]|uniref:Pyruvate:ferredoxin (Flavodoxin) oxidoreductase n=1 Tax=Candidatus Chlorohelix allophototropha TaxID=3003348 RepID=A0A8T7LY54_9CHLR|nr:pyruvate:ferredoxin (flavodoxin) oxidoreductase [Chloroflexota bacterium]WJW67794.1 pyruvate:ferredoxin (flavodoxin) oxidoreductase [Chloroflexota bacterium L227-S17]
MTRKKVMVDGNEAAGNVAYKLSEVIAVYPITPSTAMGELADSRAALRKKNIWGTVPLVEEMQSEGGAAGALHGALQTGALASTFTASQGLLLMIPNMYKIAGELTSTVFHVAARSLAAQGLSIFGDHADVMAVRATGWAMLASNNVQEAQDFAAIAHSSTLKARVPFIHFFDGFRTSHEINKIEEIGDDDLRAMIDQDLIQAHRKRALSPEHPFIRGTAQNPDVYFQGRESANPYYLNCPEIVQDAMDKFASLTGRQYKLYEYVGAPNADRVIVVMGSGAETVEETVKYLNELGERVGVLKVHLYRPFPVNLFLQALPKTVKTIAVLDRTKEPGSGGEPLYLDVVGALSEGGKDLGYDSHAIKVVGGRYGLSSKEFKPNMVKAIFDELTKAEPLTHFTVGINDDVTFTSLSFDPHFSIEKDTTVRCVFWGLGSDGTVGANKNSIKIIGEETDNYAQGYFYFDSKKSGTVTNSHLRFGPDPIRAAYLIDEADFLACHQFGFLEKYDVVKNARQGGVFLLNTSYSAEEVWNYIPVKTQQAIIDKKLKFYVIDGQQVASDTGMGGRVNTIMQTCFFALSGVLPKDQAIAKIKESIKKSYSKRGEAVVQKNYLAVDQTLANLREVQVPLEVSGSLVIRDAVVAEAPTFVRDVLGQMISLEGDSLPVSAMPVDGTYPSGTTQWEKRNLATELPVWEQDICIQCGKCVMVCPHAAIRQKVYDPALLENASPTFKSTEARFKEFGDKLYTLQVAPEDCTSCALCIEVCPVKDKKQPGRKALNFAPQIPLRAPEKANWEFFQSLPEVDRTSLTFGSIKNSQLLQPLFEFSGACSGCGETPYIKLLTQLFGDRSHIANATGCSSIFGGNLPTTPWSYNREGRGPAWSNSLFEDNAEFGLGMRLALDKQLEYVQEILPKVSDIVGAELVEALLKAEQLDEIGLKKQRERVALLKQKLQPVLEATSADDPRYTYMKDLSVLADILVRRSVWIVGGDGWAYDIGYGGLDHVLASGRNVKVLVLDTEVYSNTGGQASKATPISAVAKFASKGKAKPKKDLGLLAMSYGSVYVARVSMGANDQQTLNAFLEAEAYDGPAIIIAYAHCIAHGIDMRKGLEQQKLAVQSGDWPIYRFNPEKAEQGETPFLLDSKDPTATFEEYSKNEGRFQVLANNGQKEAAADMLQQADTDVKKRWQFYKNLANMYKNDAPGGDSKN